MNNQTTKKVNYEELKDQVEKSFSERGTISIGRGGKPVVPRKYHLTGDQLSKIKEKAEATGGVPNPFEGRVGLYYAQVEALIQLGVDEWHSLKGVAAKIEEILKSIPAKKDNKTAWDTVINRSSKPSASKPKDITGRVMQNYKVLQRTNRGNDRNPYGYKLMQLNMAIDIKFEPLEGTTDPSLGTWYYRLNTQFNSPEEVEPMYHNPIARRGRKPKK